MIFKSTFKKWLLFLFLISLYIFGLIWFLIGFFPSKIVLPGQNTFISTFPFGKTPKFDKIIVMVVDAMRSDFFYSDQMSEMSTLHSLITDSAAIPFTAFSNPPTVTLPRLKGIITGSTPSFLDAILNVADDSDSLQGLASQDSWIQQLSSAGKKIHFYGDDTWLKLLPNTFTKFEGTNSFYVSDFTEVDNNVTRHLDVELSPAHSKNWDCLILHYLGLDHIGHKGGPNSKFMKPKIKEMDDVLKRLYGHIEQSKEKTLIVLLGDHGMNLIGNHGGSNIGEVSPGLTLISPLFKKLNLQNNSPLPDNSEFSYYDHIQQIDLVPTLSSLLNLPIPKNSLGVIAKNILPLWKQSEQRSIVWENCQQLLALYFAKYGKIETEEVFKLYTSLKDFKPSSIDQYYSLLNKVQKVLATSSTNYNYTNIFQGYAALIVSLIFVLAIFNYYFLKSSSTPKSLVFFYQIFALVYAVHFHGSSLIEEEQYIWWFLTTLSVGFLGIFTFKNITRKTLLYYGLLILGLRILKSWNNSGQKWTSNFTIGYYLLNKNQEVLWILITLTYALLAGSINFQGDFATCFNFMNAGITTSKDLHQIGSLLSFMIVSVGTSVSYSYKLLQYFSDGREIPAIMKMFLAWLLAGYEIPYTGTSFDAELKLLLQEVLISMSQIASYFILGLLTLRVILGKFTKLKNGLITDISNIVAIYLIHHTRQENIPMFLVFALIKYSFTKILVNSNLPANVDQTVIITSVFTLCLQNLSFFSMGNTNLLATVDLSNAYNGIKEYQVIPIGILTFICTYVGPIYWSLSSLQIIFEPTSTIYKKNGKDITHFNFLKQSILLIKANVSLLFYSIAGISLVGSCINLRFHLFIWTVFSPKLLYFASWSILMNFGIDFVFALFIIFLLY